MKFTGKTLKIVKKDLTVAAAYDAERVKKFEILSTAELRRKGFYPTSGKGPWIQVTLVSDLDENVFETAIFPSNKWRINFN